jgi:hypothetical protein
MRAPGYRVIDIHVEHFATLHDQAALDVWGRARRVPRPARRIRRFKISFGRVAS